VVPVLQYYGTSGKAAQSTVISLRQLPSSVSQYF
jgi:hypothetical protein